MADNNILYLVAFDYKLTFRFLSQAKDGHSFFGCLQLITRLGNDRPTKMISINHHPTDLTDISIASYVITTHPNIGLTTR